MSVKQARAAVIDAAVTRARDGAASKLETEGCVWGARL